MRSARLISFLLLLLFGAAAGVHAQSVRWEPSSSGQSNAITLVFENCEPDGQPVLPSIPGVTLTFAGSQQSSQSSFGSGGFHTTRTVALSYLVRGPQNPPVQIPAFNVKTNKGPLPVAPFNVAAPAAPLDSAAGARLLPARQSVWAGEVFALNYEVYAQRRTNARFTPTFDWNPAPLVIEDWSQPEVRETSLNGQPHVSVQFRTRAIARTPVTAKLEAATHLLDIQTGTIGFGFFSQQRMEQVSVTSDQPVIEVRPLPAGAPAAFSGAVGQFKLVSKVVPEKAAVGEPVTWTLELSGTGNWPDIAGPPSRQVSNDFQVVQPKAKRTPSEGKLFDVTLVEDVVLVPSKPGNYNLGPVVFSYFDPQSGGYKTITAPRTALTITAPAAPQFSAPPQAAPPPAGQESGRDETAATPRKPVLPSTLPAGIPRDPLPGAAVARSPLSLRTLIAALLAPFAALLAFWIFLALRRAQATDPVRPRREARLRLARTLERIQQSDTPGRLPLLLAWQHDTAILWQIAHAAPAANALPAGDWSALWAEADRALYGARADLPSDWIPRAQAALVAKPVPGFKPLRLFLPKNLMPFAALLAMGFLTLSTLLMAAERDGAAAYRKADFSAAERAWRSAIEKTPTDWIARHNLSLALEQQDRPGEAAAQAAAAFVQNPAHPAVRWHFAHAAEKLGTASDELAGFVSPNLLHSFAQLASPAEWQLILILASWITAAGCAGLLLRVYGSGPIALKWASTTLLGAGLVLAASAEMAILTYGLTAEADAVIVARATTLRSIPTEADTTQKTSPLAAGALATTDKTFLDWRRLAFENGQTGWVRKEDLVPIWK
jgi:hypothetical protein